MNINTNNLVAYKRFGRNYRLLTYSALKMEAARFSETFVPVCHTMLRHKVGDSQNLTYHELAFMSADNSQGWIHRWPFLIKIMDFGVNSQKNVSVNGILKWYMNSKDINI